MDPCWEAGCKHGLTREGVQPAQSDLCRRAGDPHTHRHGRSSFLASLTPSALPTKTKRTILLITNGQSYGWGRVKTFNK
jgi:hypothetical protein